MCRAGQHTLQLIVGQQAGLHQRLAHLHAAAVLCQALLSLAEEAIDDVCRQEMKANNLVKEGAYIARHGKVRKAFLLWRITGDDIVPEDANNIARRTTMRLCAQEGRGSGHVSSSQW